MSKVIRYIFLLWIISGTSQVYAQRLGLLPSKIKWQQLSHDSLRIIYPRGHETTAKRVASLMLKTASADPISTHCKYKPISVLLQPYTNISNAYVGLAPYRSEFYLQPNENPFSLGSMSWADLLALHEYRHVQQVNAANTGLSRVVKLVFGELAFSGMYNLSIPDWYREGDAVFAETKWTKQGRGRLSSFTLPFREKAKHGPPWGYYFVRNGSYKEFTPNHYPLGYLIVQYGNHMFGEATWDTIVKQAPRYKHLIRPFSSIVKEYYGKRNKQLYQDAMEWYKEQWKAAEVPNIDYPAVLLNSKDVKNDYYNMSYPSVDGDGSILTTINTFDRTTAIYRLKPDGSKEKIISLGLQQDPYFDHREGKLVWTELRFDPRWLRQDKNVIVLYDLRTKKKKIYQPVKGYYTPSLDEKGQWIVALHVDKEGKYNLHIIEAQSGRVHLTLPNGQNLYLGYPRFSEDGRSIIATSRNREGKMCLIEQDIESGAIRQITHYSFSVLGRPVLRDNWILVAGGLDQLDQVFAVDKKEGIFYQVSGGNRAHYDPAWDPVQDAIVSSEYRLDGKKLVRLPGFPRQWKMMNMGEGIKYIPGAVERNVLDEKPVDSFFEIKKYSPWANFFNVHSWTVTANDPVWGAEVRSDNVMNTISIAGGYEFNRNNKAKGPYLNLRLGMWFPELSFGIGSLRREIQASDGREFVVANDRVNAGISLPLYFTPGVYQQFVQVSSHYNAGVSRLSPRVDGIDNFNFNYIHNRFVFINSRSKAFRQAQPSWGQRFDIAYSRQISGPPVKQFYVTADLAFPGVKASHYILFHGEYMSQDKSDEAVRLSSRYTGARGFPYVDAENQYSLGATYGFPILYPDKGIGNVFYTRRIRLQPFFDIGFVDDPMAPFSSMQSLGVEALIDFDFPPLSIGFRYSRLLSGFTGRANVFEFFFPSQRF